MAQRRRLRSTFATRRLQRGRSRGHRKGVRSGLSPYRRTGADALGSRLVLVADADAGYDVIDYRARAGVGKVGGRGRTHRARPSTAGYASFSTSSPTTPLAATPVPVGPGCRSRIAERGRYFFRDGRGPGRAAAERLAQRVRGPGVDPGERGPTGRPVSGTCTCSHRSSRMSTGSTSAGAGRTSREDPALLVRPWGRRVPDRRGPLAGQSGGLPDVGARQYPLDRIEVEGQLVRRPWVGAPALGSWTRSTSIYRGMGGSGWPTQLRPAAGLRGGGGGDGPERLGPLRPARRAAHHLQLRLPQAGWTAGRTAAGDRRDPAALAAVDAPATWVLSSHAETRHVTRFGRPRHSALRRWGPIGARSPQGVERTSAGVPSRPRRGAADPRPTGRGLRLYQGEEFGLAEVEDLPDEVLRDPAWERSGHTERGRDGCRVPLPWSGGTPPFGFSPNRGAATRGLPQPAAWAALTVEAQLVADPDSTLSLYPGGTADPTSSSRHAGPCPDLARTAEGVLTLTAAVSSDVW